MNVFIKINPIKKNTESIRYVYNIGYSMPPCPAHPLQPRSHLRSIQSTRFRESKNKKTKIFGYTPCQLPTVKLPSKNRPKSNLNTLIESPNSTTCLIAVVMLALSVAILEIFGPNVGDLDVDRQNGPRSNVNKLIKSP